MIDHTRRFQLFSDDELRIIKTYLARVEPVSVDRRKLLAEIDQEVLARRAVVS